MAVTSGFFNSLQGDRKYNAEQFSSMFNNLITDGIFSNVGNAFQVRADGSNVTIDIGRAWFNSVWVYNDTLYPLAILGAEVLLDRIDAVVIEINHTEAIRAGRIFFVQGTASADPERPVLTNTEDIHQYPLAYVYRKAGATTITQADITNMIGTSDCPYVTGILATQDIDKVVAQWEAQFNNWFEGLQVELSGDVAANLASQIIELDGRFETLARTGCVYEDLQDSANDTILDSDGNVIEGSTSFRQRSKDAPSGTGTSADVNNLKMDVTALTGRVEQVNTDLSNRINSVNSTLSPKVGDILVTARTNPGNGFILCNGAAVNRSAYSALSSLLPAMPKGPWTFKDVTLSTKGDYRYTELDDIAYGNGYYVVAGAGWTGAGNGGDTPYIAYATSLSGPWTSKKLTNIGTQYTECEIYSVRYINGNFVVCGAYQKHSTGSDRTAFIAYASNPSGAWTLKDLWSETSGGALVRDIAYGGGKYVLIGETASTIQTAYATSLGGSWTIVDMTDNCVSLNRIVYLNNTFIICGYSYRSTNTSGKILGVIYYSTNPTNYASWTKKEINSSAPSIKDIIYVNGRYILMSSAMRLYESTSLGGSWTEHIWTVSDGVDLSGFTRNRLIYINGYYTITGEVASYTGKTPVPGILYSTSLDSPFRLINGDADFKGIIYANGYIVAVSHIKSLAYIDSAKMLIPEISVGDQVYTYIKAS